MMSTDLLGEAWRVFERWRAEHDPDGEMDMLDAAAAYSKWAEANSIEKYLDARYPQGSAE